MTWLIKIEVDDMSDVNYVVSHMPKWLAFVVEDLDRSKESDMHSFLRP